jgi:hypothetical protein
MAQYDVTIYSPWMDFRSTTKESITESTRYQAHLWLSEMFPDVLFRCAEFVETINPTGYTIRRRARLTFSFYEEDVALQFKLANS